ncbi:MAG: alpha-L-arabinofuranosidase C-terminal domain-containing protein [bacterium]|nr:alpha-L-arabinofuranosidase C-terminal domain-containing protein [bacterium]
MAKAIINAKRKKGKISKYIYGQFAEHLGRCIYEGLYVDEDSGIENVNGMRCDVVNALKELDIPVLRWPGGCFADDYHWRDGIGEKSKRPYMVNTNWGKVVENNHFGTHEFFELCEQLGTEPYICGNVGSGSVKEMRDWVEYMTFGGDSPLANERRANGREEPWKLKYFGVGNENWGCGGNMRPEYYADLYRRYSVFIRNYGEEPLYKIACGANERDTRWTEVVMENAGHAMNGISLHNYQFERNWKDKGDSIKFDSDGYYTLLSDVVRMESIIKEHITVMDKYDPEKKIDLIVDEWGNWFNVMPGTNPGFLYQQNTIRDAISAMMMLHCFHEHCDRVHMANIAQMVNVLQAMVLTEGEKMVLTPTYYVFKMMKPHMDAVSLDVDLETGGREVNGRTVPDVSMSASEKDGKITISLCNTSLEKCEDLEIEIRDASVSAVTGEVMAAENMCDYNDFDCEEKLHPTELKAQVKDGVIKVTLPKMAAAVITVE